MSDNQSRIKIKVDAAGSSQQLNSLKDDLKKLTEQAALLSDELKNLGVSSKELDKLKQTGLSSTQSLTQAGKKQTPEEKQTISKFLDDSEKAAATSKEKYVAVNAKLGWLEGQIDDTSKIINESSKRRQVKVEDVKQKAVVEFEKIKQKQIGLGLEGSDLFKSVKTSLSSSLAQRSLEIKKSKLSAHDESALLSEKKIVGEEFKRLLIELSNTIKGNTSAQQKTLTTSQQQNRPNAIQRIGSGLKDIFSGTSSALSIPELLKGAGNLGARGFSGMKNVISEFFGDFNKSNKTNQPNQLLSSFSALGSNMMNLGKTFGKGTVDFGKFWRNGMIEFGGQVKELGSFVGGKLGMNGALGRFVAGSKRVARGVGKVASGLGSAGRSALRGGGRLMRGIGGAGGGIINGAGGLLGGAMNLGGSLLKGTLYALGFGALFSLTGFLTYAIGKAKALQDATPQLEGLLRKSSGGAIGQGSKYGLESPEFISYARAVAISSGSTKDIGSRASDQMGYERGMGLDQGQLNSLNVLGQRFSKGDAVMVAESFADALRQKKVFNMSTTGGDNAQFGRQLQNLQGLLQIQAQTTTALNPDLLIGMISKFAANVGGRFGTYDNISAFAKLNQGITSPDNDYKKAFLFREIQNVKPGASLYETLGVQEKGIFSELGSKMLGNIIDKFKGTSNDDMGKMLMKSLFALDNETIDLIWKSNMSFLKDLESGVIKDVNQLKTAVDAMAGQGAGLTGIASSSLAAFADNAAGVGVKILNWGPVQELMTSVAKGDMFGAFGAVGKIFMEGVKGLFDYFSSGKFVNDISNAISGKPNHEREISEKYSTKAMQDYHKSNSPFRNEPFFNSKTLLDRNLLYRHQNSSDLSLLFDYMDALWNGDDKIGSMHGVGNAKWGLNTKLSGSDFLGEQILDSYLESGKNNDYQAMSNIAKQSAQIQLYRDVDRDQNEYISEDELKHYGFKNKEDFDNQMKVISEMKINNTTLDKIYNVLNSQYTNERSSIISVNSVLKENQIYPTSK